MNKLYYGDNRKVLRHLITKFDPKIEVDLVYADMMYDSLDFEWLDLSVVLLKDTGSVFVQTDYRSVAQLKLHMDNLLGEENFVNWIIWPYDWGGRSPRRFARKHDDILWYSISDKYKFYPDRVMVPKKVTATALNPSGRTHKIPTDVWEDIGNFHTMSSERVRDEEGKSIHWQKPLKLMDRIILSTTDVGDLVLDPFVGTGSTGVSAVRNGRDFIGIEWDEKIYRIAKERIADDNND